MKPDAPGDQHLHRLPRCEGQQQPGDQRAAERKRRKVDPRIGLDRANQRKSGERDVEHEDAHDDFLDRETAIGRALIEVGAMRLPDRLAPERGGARA